MADRYWSTNQKHFFNWNQVASAYWSRYPNPNSSHVFTEDFVEVKLDELGCLHTKRIIMKTNSLPWWGKHLFPARRVALIEESIVDPKKRTLVTYTRNIGLRRFMGVTEKVTFQPLNNNTAVFKEVWIESEIVGLRRAIKKFGVDRFKKNCVLATQGFDWVMNRMYGHQGSSPPQNASKKMEALPMSFSTKLQQ